MAYNPQNPNGQATMANSAPVVIASDQTAIPITGTVTSTPSGTQTVSGTVTVQQGTAANLNATVTATNLDIRDLNSATDSVSVTGSSVSISGSVAVTGPLTDAELRATAVPVSGTFFQTTQPVSITDITTNGVDSAQLVSAAGTNLTQIKGSAGKVVGWYIYNSADTQRKVIFYNSLSAGVTVGTTTPTLTLVIPSFSGANCSFPTGINFSTAISIATTVGIANSDTTAVSLNDLNINILYK